MRLRNGDIGHAEDLRNQLYTQFGQVGNYLRFERGRQNDAGEAVDVLVGQLKNLDGKYALLEKRQCSACKNDLNVNPASSIPGHIHNLTPKESVGKMVKTSTEQLDADFVHICRVSRAKILKEIKSLDSGEYGDITKEKSAYDPADSTKKLLKYVHQQYDAMRERKIVFEPIRTSATRDEVIAEVKKLDEGPHASKETLYQVLRKKYEALREAQKKDNSITFRTIGIAAGVTESMEIDRAGDFLVISAARDPRNPIETYPTEVLTINEKDYVIRSTINHIGNDPQSGHYTASVYSNNKWYKIDDDTITEMKGRKPWPKLSTFYFYEKMQENTSCSQKKDMVEITGKTLASSGSLTCDEQKKEEVSSTQQDDLAKEAEDGTLKVKKGTSLASGGSLKGDEQKKEKASSKQHDASEDGTTVTHEDKTGTSLSSGGYLCDEEEEKKASVQRGKRSQVKAPRPIDYENVTSDELSGTKFRHWQVLRKEALSAKEEDVLPNMKADAARNKHGEMFVVDFKPNRRRLEKGDRLRWVDFDGQHISGTPYFQVFIRENKEGEYKIDKTLTFDKDLMHIISDDTGEPIPPEIEAEALVLYRVYSSLKADKRCKRKITSFFVAPPEEKILLERMVYEYWGEFPGYISYGNTKVNVILKLLKRFLS